MKIVMKKKVGYRSKVKNLYHINDNLLNISEVFKIHQTYKNNIVRIESFI